MAFSERMADQPQTQGPAVPENGRCFHHLGYVVRSIQGAAEGLARSLALEWDGRIVLDPLQTVRVSFLRPRAPGAPMLELVEPVGPESTVRKFLQRGGGLHHLCYEVESLEAQLEWTKSNRDLVVAPPVPAVAFHGRRIAWAYTRGGLLLEYLELRAPEGASAA